MCEGFSLQRIQANGIGVRAAVEGEGPLVIMVHGWPELWYSWRHQIRPFAAAGFRVVVPDVRGYGGSDRPYDIEAYDMAALMADVIGLIDAFGEEKAILMGHDWGSPIVCNTAALYPERVAAVAALSVPYRKRGEVSHIGIWRKVYAGRFFYQVYFQDVGIAEAELEADTRTSLRKIYYTASGDSPHADGWVKRPAAPTFLDGLDDPQPFPAWLTEADLDYFTSNFEASGFRGPINRYRNQDRDFADLPTMGTAPITVPSCFIGGSKDIVRSFVPGIDPYEDVSSNCTDFRGKTIIDGIGHWVQQEAPAEVNAALLAFLASVR
jgi:pimeloyl-ACP methyl ester carboxylesterase